jgi:hypothetical protein
MLTVEVDAHDAYAERNDPLADARWCCPPPERAGLPEEDLH